MGASSCESEPELLLHDGFQRGVGVDEGMIAAAVGLTQQHEGRLIDAVENPIGRNLVRRASEASEAREQVRDVHDVAHHGVCVDHAWPSGKRLSAVDTWYSKH